MALKKEMQQIDAQMKTVLWPLIERWLAGEAQRQKQCQRCWARMLDDAPPGERVTIRIRRWNTKA